MKVGQFGGTGAEWDHFVRVQPGWSHFHLHGWRDVIERVHGHECVYLGATDDDGNLAGVLPLVRVRSVVFGHYLVSMPFVNYGGPLGSDSAVRAMVEHASELASSGNVKLLELRSRTELPVEMSVSHRKVTMLLDIPEEGSAALFKRFPAKLRSQIRRPEKEGVSVRFGADRVGAFYHVFSHHMRDLGTPAQSRRLFEAVAERFGEDAWFGVAYLEGRPIACGAGLRWGNEFEITWASALAEYKKVAANMLLYWSFMERAAESGVRTFNFGRSTPGTGPHRFKAQWGAREVPLWWYHQAAGERTATPAPSDGAFAWGPRVWRHLPVPIATAIGPRIVRYIP